MAGTAAGGREAARKNKMKDPDFYKKIGARGGQAGHTGGFAAGNEGRKRASIYGAIGGAKSRRRA